MKEQLRINIPEPCSMSWDGMTAAEGGRFCGSCNKVVQDFTNYTDAELLEFFKKPQSNICVRTRTNQLDRRIGGYRIFTQKLYKWVAGLLLLFALNKASGQSMDIEVIPLTGPGTEPKFEQKSDEDYHVFELTDGTLANDSGVSRIVVKSGYDSLSFPKEANGKFFVKIPIWFVDSVFQFEFMDLNDRFIAAYPVSVKDAYKFAYAQIKIIEMPTAKILTRRPIELVTGLMGTVTTVTTGPAYTGSNILLRGRNTRHNGVYPVQNNHHPQGKMPVNISGKVLNGTHDTPGVTNMPPEQNIP